MGAAACPGCVALPGDGAVAQPEVGQIVLSVPGMHCAGCMATVERGLAAMPGVRAARVNLTLKRAMIEAAPGVEPQALVAALGRLGYEAHELDPGLLADGATDRAGRELLMRLAVAGFAMMNVMLLSVAVWSGAEGATRELMHWISAMIALPVVAFSGQPFFRNAARALRARRLNMDVPIALAILTAAGMSLVETWLGGRHAYFDAALALTFFLLAGRYLDHRTRAVARSAAQELAALEVPRALRLVGGREVVTPVADLAVGDLVRVHPGMRLPVDGVIAEGETEIDRAALTGESLPVFAGPGAEVSAGEVNLTGVLTIRVTARGEDTRLHRIAGLVALAETAKNRYTSLADRAAVAYAPGVFVLGFVGFAGWMLWSGDLRVSLNVAIATLIITCPCALGLAVPAVVTAASGRLYRAGVLLKSGTALERLAEVDTVVFDKTGTLTLGRPELNDPQGYAAADLALAAGLARGSAHPLAEALARAAEARGIAPVAPGDLREEPGYGVEGVWQGGPVRLGRAAWAGGTEAGGTATWLAREGAPSLRFSFTDQLRPGAAETVAALQAAGCRVLLLSGDSADAVRATVGRLGIGDWHAGLTPEEKLAEIETLAKAGARVLMVGDGLNDTAALAAAHVSAAPASALDAARVASDIVLMGADLRALNDCLATARRARARISENFALSWVYNAIAVPIALAGLATPLAAALAMSASSISVSLNALRLLRGAGGTGTAAARPGGSRDAPVRDGVAVARVAGE